MQHISKQCTRALKYKKWLTSKTGKHPSYSSSSFRFYHDIKANLMLCQKGLCAYTELKLDSEAFFKNNAVWKSGKYIGDKQIQGQLDHFNSKLKRTKGWEWSNFFLCHSDINIAKLDNPVFDFMKPDIRGYSAAKYLDYNYLLHEFTVSPKIKDVAQRANIKSMIETLGLNYGSIKRLRTEELNNIFIDYHVNGKPLARLKTTQFFTAFEMIKAKLLAI